MILQVMITSRKTNSQKLILTKVYCGEMQPFKEEFIKGLNDGISKLEIDKDYVVTYGIYNANNLSIISISINGDDSYNVLEHYAEEDPKYGDPFYLDINNEVIIDKEKAVKSVTILDDSNFVEQYIDLFG